MGEFRMAKDDKQGQVELEELRTRIDWLDEERRGMSRRLADLEQQLAARDRELQSRDQRIEGLEESFGKTTSQLARLSKVNTELAVMRDELVKLIEQYDQRRLQDQSELEKLRRIEHETHQRELADVRAEIAALGHLQDDMDLRKAEEARLARDINTLRGPLSSVENAAESIRQELKYLQESQSSNARGITGLEGRVAEGAKRTELFESRLDTTAHNTTRLQSSIAAFEETITRLDRNTKDWSEKLSVSDNDRRQQTNEWQRIIDEHEDKLERYSADWVNISNLYKEATEAVRTTAEWREQMQVQLHEASEMSRLELSRMRSRWDEFLVAHDKQWKNYEVDQEQRWASIQRRHQELLGQLHELQELSNQLGSESEALWRVQSAQADAMKKVPRIWLEEVEKAIAHNPDSRRQPALIPVRDE
jgi:chromosome segregation ATPase